LPLELLTRAPFVTPPDHHVVAQFIRANDDLFDGKLSGWFSYPRVVSLCDFQWRVVPALSQALGRRFTIAVISGSEDEPELKLLRDFDCATSQLSYERDKRFDLSRDWDDTYGSFDLVICNQVLEHVFDPLRAMRNIRRIIAPGGFAYVAVPTINKVHSLPEFYSAGYYPFWLERAFEHAGLTVDHVSFWGSRKYLGHLKWPPYRRLGRGFHAKVDWLDLRRPLTDGRVFSNNDKLISDTWGLARRAVG
jgi:SAM-dependent methyltransferase